MMLQCDIIDLLHERRLDLGLLQKEVAARGGFGAAILGKWERGRRQPGLPNFLAWVESLGLEVRIVPAEKSLPVGNFSLDASVTPDYSGDIAHSKER